MLCARWAQGPAAEARVVRLPQGVGVYLFLLPLLAGFGFDTASAFTTAFSSRWGERRGQLITAVLRNALGIPLWVVGLGLAIRTRSPALFTSAVALAALGWLLLTLGAVLQLVALGAIRRRAAAPSTGDELIQHGAYARVRHPIYLGLALEFLALVLIRPQETVVLACGLGLGWVVLQARCEELDLVQRIPAYRDYMLRVPRFVPRLRRPR